MRVATGLAAWLAWLWSGCAGPAPVPPSAFSALPWSAAAADQAILRARAAADRGAVPEALVQVEAVLAESPDHVDALRLRQDLLRERGRRGRLWVEAEARVRDRGDALAHYLRGRIGADPETRVRDFRRAAELDPEALWPWLGLAHALRGVDPGRAQRIYREIWSGSQGHPLVGTAYASLLRERGDHEAALAVAEQVAADPRAAAAGQLGRAQALLGLGRDEPAWQALLAAARERPGDGQVQAALQAWLPVVGSNERLVEWLDVLRERPEHFAEFAHGEGLGLLAEILQRAQQPAAALGWLEQVPHLDERPSLARMRRRLLLASGDGPGFLTALRRQVPEAVVRAEPNELRARWAQLLDGPWFQRDPLGEPGLAADLAAALLRTGYLVEAEQWTALALRRWPATAGLAALRDEVRAELAFEGGLRRILYRGYRSDPAPDLDAVLADLRELSLRCFRRDVVGVPPRFVLPLVGELLDPFQGSLAEHFGRYNRHCVIGQRSGGAVEGMLLSRWSLAELPASAELPLSGRCREVVCFDRDVRALTGVVGGDVAGLALLDHFLVDHDAVRDWARSLRDRRRVARADGLALLQDPLPEAAVAGMDPFDVSWRLALQAPVADADLDDAVLEMIRCHERQHLVDAFQHLPIEANLGRSLGLLWQFGPSPVSIQAEMERRAELAALACSAHPELVLAHIADFQGESGGASPHHRGFGELGRQLVAALVARGVAEADALPSRWHLLDMALVQRAARDLFASLPR